MLRDVTARLPSGAVLRRGSVGMRQVDAAAPAEPARGPGSRIGPLPRRPTSASATCSRCAGRSAWCRSCPALLEGTVADNIDYAAQLAGKQPDAARLLDLAGLDASFADRDADRLSVGEQQRVMLARALALEPAVLLLDEPTSALDEAARDSVERTLLGLRERLGVSWVLVTHDAEQAARMADWVLTLSDQGTVVSEGATPAAARA